MVQFDQVLNRKGTNCAKWDRQGGDFLPMWVADMDFQAPKPLLDAVEKRLKEGVFGYPASAKAAEEAVIGHYQRQYQVTVKPEWIVWIPSVMPGANLACRVGGGKILYSTPMYTHIRRLPQEARAEVTEVPMKETNLFYSIDFEALERAVTPETGVYVLCNPHNPVGRVFTRTELEQTAAFAKKHGLLVVADEIHCELTLEGTHIPYFSLNEEARENSITLCSAGKIANIPGLPLAYAIIPNTDLRGRFEGEALGLFSVRNTLAETALTAAYDGSCDTWKEELRSYLKANRDYLEERIAKIPGMRAVHNQATYLVWIDARESGISDPFTFFREQAGVHLNDGKTYGQEGFVRLNFGCPRSQLKEALDRMEAAILRNMGEENVK